MRVFVLCTGRTGSSSIAKAFSHATNFTSAHESRYELAAGRLDYPDQHIEVDNRLSWFTGSLTKQYPDAFIVHLTRSEDEVVASYRRRFRDAWSTSGRMRSSLTKALKQDQRLSIVEGFAHSILFRAKPWPAEEIDGVLRLYRTTVDDNIELLMRHHDHARIDLATVAEDFRVLWERIGATGDLDAALYELTIHHNATGS